MKPPEIPSPASLIRKAKDHHVLYLDNIYMIFAARWVAPPYKSQIFKKFDFFFIIENYAQPLNYFENDKDTLWGVGCINGEK